MRALAMIAVLFVGPSLEAKPHVKTILRKTLEYSIYAAPLVTSALATHEGHLCRQRNDVAACSGGYGPFAARESVRFSFSVTTAGMALYGHKARFRDWFVPALGTAAFDGYIAYHEGHVRGPLRRPGETP